MKLRSIAIGNFYDKTKHTTEKNFSFVIGCFNAVSNICTTPIQWVHAVYNSMMYLRHVFQVMNFTPCKGYASPLSTIFPLLSKL